jgi:hypothetical protein
MSPDGPAHSSDLLFILFIGGHVFRRAKTLKFS